MQIQLGSTAFDVDRSPQSGLRGGTLLQAHVLKGHIWLALVETLLSLGCDGLDEHLLLPKATHLVLGQVV